MRHAERLEDAFGQHLAQLVLRELLDDQAKQQEVGVAVEEAAAGREVEVPVARAGIEQVFGAGAEGRIRGRTAEGAEIAFFDALFFKNAEAYRVGESYQFALSAFAYCARPLGLRLLKGDGEASVPADVLKPARSGASDDYDFRATVQHVYPMRVAGRTVFRMRVTVGRSGQSMLDVALYAAEHILPEGYIPKPGDEITGRLWLQGYLVED